MLVPVAEVVFSELPGRVALLFEQIGDGGRPIRNAVFRPRHANRQKSGAERMLPKDEGGTSGGAALLSIGVCKQNPLLGNPVDIGGLVTHYAMIIGADVVNTDVVAPDDK